MALFGGVLGNILGAINPVTALTTLAIGALANKNKGSSVPTPPPVQTYEPVSSSENLNYLFEDRMKELENIYKLTPTGISDDVLLNLRNTMAQDRDARFDESRQRTIDRATDLGRASSSATSDELRALESAYTREAESADAQMALLKEQSYQTNADRLADLRSRSVGEMLNIWNAGAGAGTQQQLLGYDVAKLEAQRKNDERDLITKVLGGYFGSQSGNEWMKNIPL